MTKPLGGVTPAGRAGAPAAGFDGVAAAALGACANAPVAQPQQTKQKAKIRAFAKIFRAPTNSTLSPGRRPVRDAGCARTPPRGPRSPNWRLPILRSPLNNELFQPARTWLCRREYTCGSSPSDIPTLTELSLLREGQTHPLYPG